LNKYAIIVAGGNGSRMGSDIPKQFMEINGVPMLYFSLQKFYEADRSTKIILVLPDNYISYWENHKLFSEIPHNIIAGGEERFFSVLNALHYIESQYQGQALVAIHDAARPLVSTTLINHSFEAALLNGAVVPAIPIPFSMRTKVGPIWKATDRKNYINIQTPQVFNLLLLLEAYQQAYTPAFTDDASVFEAAGHTISIIDGEELNLKVSTPLDFEWVCWKMSNNAV